MEKLNPCHPGYYISMSASYVKQKEAEMISWTPESSWHQQPRTPLLAAFATPSWTLEVGQAVNQPKVHSLLIGKNRKRRKSSHWSDCGELSETAQLNLSCSRCPSSSLPKMKI